MRLTVDIPVQNVYFLLCYAWDKLAEREVVDVEGIESTTLVNLFARVLINGVNHLLKRGFDRGYVQQHEWTNRLRGRICFQEALRRDAELSVRLPCDFDDLSYSVLHNQILKATMARLVRTSGVAPENAEGLSRLIHLFADIPTIEVTKDCCINNGTMVLEVRDATSRIGGLAGRSAASGAGALRRGVVAP